MACTTISFNNNFIFALSGAGEHKIRVGCHATISLTSDTNFDLSSTNNDEKNDIFTNFISTYTYTSHAA